jgi:hypothetical protein
VTNAIPSAALTQHVAIVGKTGSGKTSTAKLAIEQVVAEDSRVCILDPIKSDWWGLKSSADGKSDGFPIVIFGGKHADVPLVPGSGRAVAELLSTANFPTLIDLRGWRPGDRTKWYIDFMEATFDKSEGKRFIMISEVHNFAPKGKVLSPQAGEMLHWSNRLASEGRGLGLTLLADSQRPQKVHNDLLTSCETLIACRVIHKSDRLAVEEWIDGCADTSLGKQVIRELASMKKPDSWVWSPEIDFGPQRVEWPMFATFDSFKPQEAASTGKLKGWAEINLDDVKTKLATIVQEAQANDPAALRKQIAELQRQVKLKQPAVPKAAPPPFAELLQAAETRGYARGFREARNHAKIVMKDVARGVTQAIRQPLIDGENEINTMEPETAPAMVAIHPQKRMASVTRQAIVQVAAHVAVRRSNGAGEPLPKGEVATLGACIQYPDGLRREQLTVLTGYKRSTRDAYIQRLRERGYLDAQGDRVIATEAGIAALPDFEPLPTGEALQRFWFERLPEGECAILKALIETHPDAVERSALDESTGFKRSTRDAYLARLAAKQLVTEPTRGMVRASEELFS